MENDRITLRDAFLHSKQCETLRIYNSFDLTIRPWAPAQLQDALPLIARIAQEFKGRLKEESLYEAIIDIVQKSDELMEGLKHLVYVTIERCNATITMQLPEKPAQVVPLFSESEMNEWLELSYILDIAKIAWKQNFEKNLSGGLNLVNSPKAKVEDRVLGVSMPMPGAISIDQNSR